jgi:RNA polymerase sigma-70 factor (ECF subfamily)
MLGTDEELMLAYKQGNVAAFQQLITRYQRMLFGVTLAHVHYERATAEDIIQNVWMRVIQHKDQYEVKASFKTYLFTIQRSVLIDYLRANKRHINLSWEELTDGEEPSDLDDWGQSADDPELIAIRRQSAAKLHAMVKNLPEHHQIVLHYVLFADLSLPEIATQMGVSLECAKSRLRYAKQALRQETQTAQYDF